ncbi:MAG: DsrH/TusB family sulfur metabolism protein [bacterium]|nr:DsrH/TusB family sulfur metabolism protein [bacterium]
MRLGVFVSDLRGNEEMLDRLEAEKLGVFLVENGIYHAVIKEDGKSSPVIRKEDAEYYVLTEDLQTRGFTSFEVDSKVNVVTYSDMVDLTMETYEKLVWL